MRKYFFLSTSVKVLGLRAHVRSAARTHFISSFGHIGPFQGAIALTVLALLMVLPWPENYGESEEKKSSIKEQFIEGWKTTLSNSNIWKIGMTQALSEGAMYTVSGYWLA